MRLPESLHTTLGHVLADILSPLLLTKGTLTPTGKRYYKAEDLQPDKKARPAKLSGKTLVIPEGGGAKFRVKDPSDSGDVDDTIVYDARVFRERWGHTSGLVVWAGQGRDNIVANLDANQDQQTHPVLGNLEFIP